MIVNYFFISDKINCTWVNSSSSSFLQQTDTIPRTRTTEETPIRNVKIELILKRERNKNCHTWYLDKNICSLVYRLRIFFWIFHWYILNFMYLNKKHHHFRSLRHSSSSRMGLSVSIDASKNSLPICAIADNVI